MEIQNAFDVAKADCAQALASIDNQRRQLLYANWRWRLFIFIGVVIGIAIIGTSLFLLFVIGRFWGLESLVWGLMLDAAIISVALDQFRAQRKRVEMSIELAYQEAFSTLVAHAQVSRQGLAAAEVHYHQACTNYCSYPPDWEWRRQQVLSRDNYQCTGCRWPEGFVRRSRELHVHHKESLARGGDNSLENLVTLCHICHRKVDADHRLVKKHTGHTHRRRFRR